MSSNPTLTNSNCPNCGAPVDLTHVKEDALQVRCEHCGSLLNLPARPHIQREVRETREVTAQTVVINVGGNTDVRRPTVTTSSSGGCLGLIIPLVILGFVGFILWQTGVLSMMGIVDSPNTGPGKILSVDVPSIPAISSITANRAFGNPVALPAADDRAQEVAYLSLDGNSTHVVLFDTAKQAERWKSKGFSNSFTSITMAADDARLYVGDGDRLTALNRTDGEVVWEASLANKLQDNYRCTGNPCLRVLGNKVVVLQKDGTVQALEAATGRPAWNKRMNYTSSPLFDVLGNPAVIDTADGSNTAGTFTVFDLNSGETTQEISPKCSPGPFDGTAFASDDWMISADGASLYVVKDASYPCAWKFDLKTGEQLWRYQAEGNDVVPFIMADSTLLAEQGLVLADGAFEGRLAVLDAQTGEGRELFADKKYQIAPILVKGDVLVVTAVPSFDREKREVWGLDLNTGEKTWQMSLQTKHAFDDWRVFDGGASLLIVQSQWEGNKLLLDVIDPATAVSKGQITDDISHADLSGATAAGNLAILNVGTKLHAIDMTTGKEMWAH